MQPIIDILQEIQSNGLTSLGIYIGKFKGIVIDNNDPQKNGALMLQCPQVWGENVTLQKWVGSCGIWSGKNCGEVAIPQKGENVWIEFEQGNPNFPLWSYYRPLENELPSEAKQNYTETYIIAKTPQNCLFSIDDANQEIELRRNDGKGFFITDNAISLVRKNGKISLGQNGQSAQPAVLGNDNAQRLNEICDALLKVVTQLGVLIGAEITESAANAAVLPVLSPASGVFVAAAGNVIAQLTKITQEIATTKTQIPNTKSQNVTLD